MNQNFSIKNLTCEQVVVFQDRAEVKRSLKTTLLKGETEIVLTHVTSSIDKDSVRVEGHGNATVLDVICDSKSVQIDTNETNEKLQQSKLEIKDFEKRIEETKMRLERVNKKTDVINQFASTLAKPMNSSSTDKVELASSKENVDNFLTFMEIYTTQLENLDQEKLNIQNELNDLNDKIRLAKENHDRLASGSNFEQKIEITILVETKQEKSDVNLGISYLVHNASWSPKYDIRVFGKDKSMVINYFGLITQTTGEDWNDTSVSLSTAVPSIGGNVPVLGTQKLRINNYYRATKKRAKSFAFKEKSELYASGLMELSSSVDYLETEANTSSIGSTTTFNIPRKASIPSDTKTHKVSIAIINLSPEFEYQIVPKKNPYAYIKAKVKNNSNYPILEGPANVFLDNNFVSKTDLESYSPQEELDLSLGVDPAIRIDYKPVKKYTTQSGFTSKRTTNTYVQEIEVKNTSQNKAKILLIDHLPLSTDEKIQVKLLEPVLKTHPNIRLNKLNNLEFDLEIEPSKKEEIIIKYTIENPSEKEIEFF